MMIEESNKDNFHKIISQLQKNQPIIFQQQNQSHKLGQYDILVSLFILLYNINHQSHSRKNKQRQTIRRVQNDKFMLINKILPLISKLVDFPQPALSLAQFNFEQYSSFCQQNGFSVLLRHSKGILPYIYKNRDQIPVYYPYYDSLNFQSFGNRNWKKAREVLNQNFKFYKQKYMDSIIQMCYFILIGSTQLKERVSNSSNKWNIIWADTYLKFLDQGLKRAQNQQNSQSQSMDQERKDLYFPNFQFSDPLNKAILIVIKMIIQNQYANLPIVLSQIQKINNDDYNSLLISIIYKTSQLIGNKSVEQNCRQKFQRLLVTRNIKKEQMMKIFLNHKQIVYYFNSNNIFPEYQFNTKIMQDISTNYLNKNPNSILKVLPYINNKSMCFKLLNNTSLRDLSIGPSIIKHLKDNQHKYIQILSNQNNGSNFMKDYQEFIKIWNYYYQGVSNIKSDKNEKNDKRLLSIFELIKQPTYRYSQKFKSYIIDPRESQPTVYTILKMYSSLLIEKLRLNKHSYIPMECYEAYKKDYFLNMLRWLQGDEIDEIWSILSEAMLKDEDLIYDLLM